MSGYTSTSILIIGESGSGKSTSIRNLPSENTFIISVLGKPLPFKNWKNNYKSFEKNKDGVLDGNMFITDDSNTILKILDYISKSMPHIKYIVIDDFQYLMCNEYMRSAKEKGYEKFISIGKHAWDVAIKTTQLRSDINVFVLSHSEIDDTGKIRAKTIGKLLSEKVSLEGMFTIVLNSIVTNGKYKFMTESMENNIAKSPLDMFDKFIDNDLLFVAEQIKKYEDSENSLVHDQKPQTKKETMPKTKEEPKTVDEYLQDFKSAENEEELKVIYTKAFGFYKNNKESMMRIIVAKDDRKNELLSLNQINQHESKADKIAAKIGA